MFNELIVGDRTIYHLTLMFDEKETKHLKKFLKGVRRLDVRIGMDSKGSGLYFAQFIDDAEALYDDEKDMLVGWQYPHIPNR